MLRLKLRHVQKQQHKQIKTSQKLKIGKRNKIPAKWNKVSDIWNNIIDSWNKDSSFSSAEENIVKFAIKTDES